MLRFYASRFSAVEVNNSFYRIPADPVLNTWAGQVPSSFRFVLKASRRITHNYRLANTDGSLEYFLRAINPLGPRLGPTLFQLPPTFEKNVERLAHFLGRLPPRWPAALEFRHQSWFDDEVYSILRSHNAALVAVDDAAIDGPSAPLVPTASWGYLRLRRLDYDAPALSRWTQRIRSQPWSEAYVFLKHEEGGPTGPDIAVRLKAMLDHPA